MSGSESAAIAPLRKASLNRGQPGDRTMAVTTTARNTIVLADATRADPRRPRGAVACRRPPRRVAAVVVAPALQVTEAVVLGGLGERLRGCGHGPTLLGGNARYLRTGAPAACESHCSCSWASVPSARSASTALLTQVVSGLSFSRARPNCSGVSVPLGSCPTIWPFFSCAAAMKNAVGRSVTSASIWPLDSAFTTSLLLL